MTPVRMTWEVLEALWDTFGPLIQVLAFLAIVYFILNATFGVSLDQIISFCDHPSDGCY